MELQSRGLRASCLLPLVIEFSPPLARGLDRHTLTGQQQMRRKRLPAEKRSDWTFLTVDDGSWVWHVTHADGSKATSKRHFSTVKECVADATRNGYVAWIPEAERRSDRSKRNSLQPSSSG
ncbi:MAG: hypothetical protein ACXWIT_15435 [Burkholderiales bacterium]